MNLCVKLGELLILLGHHLTATFTYLPHKMNMGFDMNWIFTLLHTNAKLFISSPAEAWGKSGKQKCLFW